MKRLIKFQYLLKALCVLYRVTQREVFETFLSKQTSTFHTFYNDLVSFFAKNPDSTNFEAFLNRPNKSQDFDISPTDEKKSIDFFRTEQMKRLLWTLLDGDVFKFLFKSP